jgi:D-sedoheptulose 7-phosphate isomerase
MTIESIKNDIQASIDLKSSLLLDDRLAQKVLDISMKCVQTLNSGGKIIFCGNGGSFADAQHLSAEFTSRFLFDRPGLSSIALGTNSSAMTAIGNDYGYSNVFSREIEAIGNSNDFLIAITTSGNSCNIIKAIKASEDIGINTVVFTGQSRGKLGTSVETLNIPSSNTARIQECHILLGHIICRLVEASIFKSEYSLDG